MDHQATIRSVLTGDDRVVEPAGNDYRLAPDVLFLKVWDGSSRLIDLGGKSFGLPAISTTLLEITLREGADRAAHEVAGQSLVPVERVRADLEPFLDNLDRLGLLARRNRVDRRTKRRGGTTSRPMARVLRFAVQTVPGDMGKAWVLLGLATVCLRLIGWARTVDLWREASGEVSPAMDASGDPSRRDEIDHTVCKALAHSVFSVDCKARALCCWAMLRSIGIPARLVVGFDLFPFLGHCWCESGSVVMADRAERCARFTPVVQYP
jgi:hypothetical protein